MITIHQFHALLRLSSNQTVNDVIQNVSDLLVIAHGRPTPLHFKAHRNDLLLSDVEQNRMKPIDAIRANPHDELGIVDAIGERQLDVGPNQNRYATENNRLVDALHCRRFVVADGTKTEDGRHHVKKVRLHTRRRNAKARHATVLFHNRIRQCRRRRPTAFGFEMRAAVVSEYRSRRPIDKRHRINRDDFVRIDVARYDDVLVGIEVATGEERRLKQKDAVLQTRIQFVLVVVNETHRERPHVIASRRSIEVVVARSNVLESAQHELDRLLVRRPVVALVLRIDVVTRRVDGDVVEIGFGGVLRSKLASHQALMDRVLGAERVHLAIVVPYRRRILLVFLDLFLIELARQIVDVDFQTALLCLAFARGGEPRRAAGVRRSARVENALGAEKFFLDVNLLFQLIDALLLFDDDVTELLLRTGRRYLRIHATLILLRTQFRFAQLLVPDVIDALVDRSHRLQAALNELGVQIDVLSAPAFDRQVETADVEKILHVETDHSVAEIAPESRFPFDGDRRAAAARRFRGRQRRIVHAEDDWVVDALAEVRIAMATLKKGGREAYVDVTEEHDAMIGDRVSNVFGALEKTDAARERPIDSDQFVILPTENVAVSGGEKELA